MAVMSNTPDTRHDSVTSNVVRLKNNRTEIRPLRDCRALPPPGVTESFRVIPLPVLKNKKKTVTRDTPGGNVLLQQCQIKKLKNIYVFVIWVYCARGVAQPQSAGISAWALINNQSCPF